MKAQHFFAITLRASLLLLFTLLQSASVAYAHSVPFPTSHTLSNAFNGASSLLAADVDQDGDLDVVGAAWEGDEITWWENVSSPRMEPGSYFRQLAVDENFDGAHSVTVADIDGDGDMDILGAADLANQITWWENSSADASTWTEHTVDDNFDGARSVYAADLDGDGDQDILGAAWRLGAITWWENRAGDGSAWNEHPVNENLAGATSVHAQDIDSDGDLDILAASESMNSITWWENRVGNASTWNEHTLNASFGGARSALAVDMDNDGDFDVLGAAMGDNEITWWENVNGDASTWSTHFVDENFDGAISAMATDIDMDGDLDVLGAGQGADDITWWENTSGNAHAFHKHTINENFGNASSVYTGDIDNDGDLDVLSAAFEDNSITWWENETIHRTAFFYDSHQSLGNADSNAVALGDVDSDGDLDVFVANGNQANTVWLNDGQARMSLSTSLGSLESTDVALGDLDGDGDLDAFVTNNQAQANKVWLNDGSGVFTDNGQSLGTKESWGVALEDLDGDGDLDAYVANRGEGNKVWLNDGSALFTDSGQSHGNSSSVNVALGDLDGDSDFDAYVANVDAQANKVWLNNGDGVFTDSRQGLGSLDSYGIALGDMDSDGDLDAFIANLGFNKVWLNNGDGVFVDSLQHLGYLQSRSVALGDVDLDGDLDAFVTNTFARINNVWLNNGDATFSNRGQNLGNSNSKNVALGDLDHDGTLDAFVANDEGNQLYQNGAGQVALHTTDTAPTSIEAETADDVLKIVATHNGRDGDHDAELVTFNLLFEEAADDPLTTTEANALLENLHIYLDDNGSGRFDGNDTLVTTMDTLALSSGVQSIPFTDGDPNVQLEWDTPRTYLVVVELTADAHIQTPSSFRVTHITANSTAEDRDFDTPLTLKIADSVSSSITTATGTFPPEATNTPIPMATATKTPVGTPTNIPTATATGTPRASNTPVATPISATPTVIPDPSEPYEPNDSCSQASSISTEGIVQRHTFYTAGDVDWVAFSVNAGTEYIIEALTPAASVADVVLEVYDRCNGGTVGTQGFSFTPDIRLKFEAPSTGTYYLRLSNHDLDPSTGSGQRLGGENVNYDLSVRVVPDEANPGALILVAGRLHSNDNLQDNIHHTTNAVYQLFQEHGYDESRIRYLATDFNLNPDNNPATKDVDGLPSPKNLEYAITEWAKDKVGPDRALTLYLMDHGHYDRLYLNGRSQRLSPSELDSWLDRIEAAVPDLRVNVIVEACSSGSFIDLDQSVSQEGRVVITSTSANSLAYASENGAVFSDALIESLNQGSSLYGAFEKARAAAKIEHPDQTPWLDDNGDSVPNDSDDGNEAGQRGFTFAGTFPASQWPPYIASAQIAEISNQESTITAEVRDDHGVVSVWAVIYKPSYVPPKVSEEMAQEILPTVQLQELDGDGVYSGLYENFDEIGQYRIVIHALDTDEAQSQPQQITIQTGWALYLPMVIR